ncbi:predicted protein [Sclerotinia sclerotiorum 1980 UF-70]|uniref:Uncharacterized protein n=1 Tax=Sclerotinia sclerotiorum (strain ATCC 18683 / 1980 / Ss-1) TaxID=665079 RepID=A7F6D6_SCLS1|nr:predicted protein [Sclerotinia sclerotiorum 1980 UF-70]EDN98307.1 predicted protein [Sclerotinia sclerotiorum 1980 UF-70]
MSRFASTKCEWPPGPRNCYLRAIDNFEGFEQAPATADDRTLEKTG